MYDFAVNKQKLARAIEKAGAGASEEDVQKAYVEMGGKLTTNEQPMEQENEVIVETPVEEVSVESEASSEETPIENTPEESVESIDDEIVISTDDVAI